MAGRYDFNSIKVQFKRTPHGFVACIPKFQFHKGSIQTTVLNISDFVSLISIP